MRVGASVLAVALALVSSADAQQRQRVVVLDLDGCRGARILPTDWLVAPSPCPGAALARACGIVIADCPSVADVNARIDDAQLAACAPSAELLAAAGALYDAGALDRAYALYRLAARVPSVRAIASFRAGRTAMRASRDVDAVSAFGDVLGGGPVPTALRDGALFLLSVGVLANYDGDGDGTIDPTFPEARFATTFLPDAPWAREAAIAAVREIRMAEREELGTRAVAAAMARWPDLGIVALSPAPEPSLGDGDLDRTLVPRVVTTEALAACTASAPTTLAVHFEVGTAGAVTDIEVTPLGTTATCVAGVFRAARFPPPVGGSARQDGIVSFAP